MILTSVLFRRSGMMATTGTHCTTTTIAANRWLHCYNNNNHTVIFSALLSLSSSPSPPQSSTTTTTFTNYFQSSLTFRNTVSVDVSSSSSPSSLRRRLISSKTATPSLYLASSQCYRYYSKSTNSQDQQQQQQASTTIEQQLQQPFVPMTAQEEETEKVRVSQLSEQEKDMELRYLNRQIATLEKKRGINTGELYTWSGRYKALARDYGMPLLAWYWAIWVSTGLICYTTITVFDLDVMYLLQQFDLRTGYNITDQINPEYGKIGIALVANEVIEPIRLPIVIVTVKPVIDKLFPPKY